MKSPFEIFALGSLLLCIVTCTRAPRPLLENLNGIEDRSDWTLRAASGTRDGDRLDARIEVAGAAASLTVELHFEIGSPTKLATGTWSSQKGQSGVVTARSITFLGGQSGPPSLGGTFDLLGDGGSALYRLHLPTTELKVRF